MRCVPGKPVPPIAARRPGLDFRNSLSDFNNVSAFVTQGILTWKRVIINNFDARWELSPAATSDAASFFKTFENWIEQTTYPSERLQTFNNAKGARNYGFELEFRFGR